MLDSSYLQEIDTSTEKDQDRISFGNGGLKKHGPSTSVLTKGEVLITILPTAGDGEGLAEEKVSLAHTSALMSEPALAKYWDLPEEDEAWEHLQDL